MSAPMHGLEQELRQHAGALRALALRLVGPAHADDLVQETSLLAWAQRPDERGGLGGWLRSVLRHRAGKLQRGDARRTRRERAVVPGGAAPSPPDLAAQREAMTALHGALLALPAPYQGVLLQRFFQDLTPAAIAAHSGVPLATVKSQLQRGLALLRERLDADGRRDWRAAFAGAFALSGATMLMSTKVAWLVGSAAAALLCVVLWPDGDTASPAAGTAHERVVAARAADVGDATSEPQRTEAVAAATPDATSSAPMRIRIVDAFDGEPLPDFTVRLERNGPGHTMTRTDARGEAEIDGAWRDRDVTVMAIDDGRAEDPEITQSHGIAATQWPTDDRCLDVPFAVGPTYRLLFDIAPPDTDLAAVLIAGDNPEHAADDARHPVRSGTLPWVRFSARVANPSRLGDGPWTLVVFGRAWMAVGPVQQVRGAQATPVLLRACACGVLRVEASVEGGRGDHRLNASIYPLDDAGAPIGERGRHFDPARGEIEIPTGKYRVFVLGPDRQLHREDVAIDAAATTVVRAAFRAARERSMKLQVVLRSQTGTRQVGDLPEARHVGDNERAFARYVDRREDGAMVYELAGLLPGEWDVTIGPTPHLPPWDATTKRVRADAGSVEFVCLDAGAPPPGHGTLRVIDAATNKPVVGAGVTTMLDGRNHGARAGDNGIAFLGYCLAGQTVQVLVRAAGYAPAWFQMTASDNAEAPARDVALRPGWGTLLTVVRTTTEHSRGEPLPGVRVLVDGVLAGTTDARGFLLLSTASRPARIELQHGEYVHAYGGLDAATGAPDGQTLDPFFVVMEKKAK